MNFLHLWSRPFANRRFCMGSQSQPAHKVFKKHNLHSLQPHGSPGWKPPWFQSHLRDCPRAGGSDVGQTLLSLGRSSVFVRLLPMVGCCAGGWCFGETIYLLLLPILMWPLYPLWSSCLASFQVLFRGNYSVYSYRFTVSREEVTFRIFLCCHTEPSPLLGLFLVFLTRYKYSWGRVPGLWSLPLYYLHTKTIPGTQWTFNNYLCIKFITD